MIDLIFTDAYKKREKKFLLQHRDLAKSYFKTLKLLSLNPNHPSLRLHQIRSKSCHSVSINMQYRITLTLKRLPNGEIILIDVGDHDIYR
jgi:plasmid maintenance system killer protein